MTFEEQQHALEYAVKVLLEAEEQVDQFGAVSTLQSQIRWLGLFIDPKEEE